MTQLEDPYREPEAIPPKEKTFFQQFGMKVILSIAVSCCGGLLMNSVGIMNGVRYVCAAGSRILGDPWKGDGGIIRKLEQKIEEEKPHLPHVPVLIQQKSQETLEFEAKEREEKRIRGEESERNSLYARADVINFPYDKEWTLEKLRIEVRNAEQAVREVARMAEYDRERKALLAEAEKLGMVVPEEMNNKKLKDEIALEKKFRLDDASYQEKLRVYRAAMARYHELLKHGPNARCRCGMTARFGPERINTQYLCNKCRGIYPVSQAMAFWRPPVPPKAPTPPSRKTGFLKRLFG